MINRLTTLTICTLTVPRYTFARVKKHSEWIYSSKGEEMSQIHKGRIFICSDTGKDTYNCTLRMHKAFELGFLVLAHNPIEVSKLLKTISKKDRFVENSLSQTQTNAIVQSTSEQQLVTFSKNRQKQIGLNAELQLSKNVEMNVQIQHINKGNNDRQNRLLKQQQDQLIKFMEITSIKDQLQIYKHNNGHSRVISLTQNLEQISKLRQGGVDVVCVISESQIQTTKRLFDYLQANKFAYQVLPASNQLINMLAATGFPADRFAIEYFPISIQQILKKRKLMKMTVALTIKREEFIHSIQAVIAIYGKEHMIYVQNEQRVMIYRGVVGQALQNIEEYDEGKHIRMAIAPYLSTFNEGLKEQKSKVSRLYGQAMDENTHFVKMEFINDQLHELLKRKDSREVVVDNMILEVLGRVKSEQKVLKIVKDLLKLPDQQSQLLVERAKKHMVFDHLGLDYIHNQK